MPFNFYFQIWQAGNISLYQFDFNSLWSISSDLRDLARSFKTGLKKSKCFSPASFFGAAALFFIISNVCTN